MKLASKKVKVATRKINATVTKELIQDLSYTSYEYKFENESEKLIIEKYFNVKEIKEGSIIYYLTNKDLRKIKLLGLKYSELSEIFKKIIKNSKAKFGYGIDCVQELEKTLVDELCASIDKNILKWEPTVKFDELVKIMVSSDLELARKESINE